MKRFLSVFLVVCLLFSFTACVAPPAASYPAVMPGRWIEEKIDLPMPEAAHSLKLQAHNGVLDAVFYDVSHTLVGWSRSADKGKTWEALDISFIREATEDFAAANCNLFIGSDENVWLSVDHITSPPASFPLFQTAEEVAATEVHKLYHIQNGQAVPVPVSAELTAYCRFFPLPDGSCIAVSDHDPAAQQLVKITPYAEDFQIDVVPLDSKPNQFSVWEIRHQKALVSSIAYTSSTASSVVSLYDTSDTSTIQLPFASAGSYSLDDNGGVYFASNEGIQYLAPGSSMAEELLSGKSYYLGGASNRVCQLTAFENDLFVVLNDSELLHYYYDSSAVAPQADSLTVFSMHDDFIVRQTIAALRLTNPGLTVIYRIGDEETGEGMTKDSLIKSLNTELLAGTGPDVMLLDDLGAFESYLESGVFMDLTALVDTDGLYPNLLKTGEYAGGLYAIPGGICFPAVASLYNDLKSRSNGLPIETASLPQPADTFPDEISVSEVLAQSKAQAERGIRQETAQGNQQIYLLSPGLGFSFEGLYAAAVPDLADVTSNFPLVRSFLESLSWMKLYGRSDKHYYNMKYASHYPLMDAVMICDIQSLLDQKAFLAPNFPTYCYTHITPLTSPTGKKVFFPCSIAAIPNKKDVNPHASVFVNAMLSEEVQSQLLYKEDPNSYTCDGTAGLYTHSYLKGGRVPVRESCLLETRFNKLTSGFLMGDAAAPLRELHDAVTKLDTPAFLDVGRADSFYNVVKRYMDGNITMEEVEQELSALYSNEDTLSALEKEK